MVRGWGAPRCPPVAIQRALGTAPADCQHSPVGGDAGPPSAWAGVLSAWRLARSMVTGSLGGSSGAAPVETRWVSDEAEARAGVITAKLSALVYDTATMMRLSGRGTARDGRMRGRDGGAEVNTVGFVILGSHRTPIATARVLSFHRKLAPVGHGRGHGHGHGHGRRRHGDNTQPVQWALFEVQPEPLRSGDGGPAEPVLVVAFRGTQDAHDALLALGISAVDLRSAGLPGTRVHAGFLAPALTVMHSIRDEVAVASQRLRRGRLSDGTPTAVRAHAQRRREARGQGHAAAPGPDAAPAVWLTGHSLGGAVAEAAHAYLMGLGLASDGNQDGVWTEGQQAGRGDQVACSRGCASDPWRSDAADGPITAWLARHQERQLFDMISSVAAGRTPPATGAAGANAGAGGEGCTEAGAGADADPDGGARDRVRCASMQAMTCALVQRDLELWEGVVQREQEAQNIQTEQEHGQGQGQGQGQEKEKQREKEQGQGQGQGQEQGQEQGQGQMRRDLPWVARARRHGRLHAYVYGSPAIFFEDDATAGSAAGSAACTARGRFAHAFSPGRAGSGSGSGSGASRPTVHKYVQDADVVPRVLGDGWAAVDMSANFLRLTHADRLLDRVLPHLPHLRHALRALRPHGKDGGARGRSGGGQRDGGDTGRGGGGGGDGGRGGGGDAAPAPPVSQLDVALHFAKLARHFRHNIAHTQVLLAPAEAHAPYAAAASAADARAALALDWQLRLGALHHHRDFYVSSAIETDRLWRNQPRRASSPGPP